MHGSKTRNGYITCEVKPECFFLATHCTWLIFWPNAFAKLLQKKAFSVEAGVT